MKHYITDLDGNLLEVTDLKEAIFQVAMYISYLHDQPSEEQAVFAIRRKIYWKDIYTKLNQLRKIETQQTA
ncbi:MAG: hypothetical protein P0Y49_04795 [Candidatus Pedobacter colombiensis]|uniref:Uncharacterized protein n=1 Tax=Candidatus Pedobacter colombiensis TaxID=3121371 RepID=A0AAJ5W9L8_9SPHI|nr:hypothetical protein [Pedobacter sp.]WEK20454.1 MAG: hypothetical protein P0Y49_04795 [Pedobacter sp.]